MIYYLMYHRLHKVNVTELDDGKFRSFYQPAFFKLSCIFRSDEGLTLETSAFN